MGKIRCDAYECKYNNKNYCIKEGIYVRDDTFCESYKKGMLDKTFALEFALFEDNEKSITCNACDCIHNNDKRFKAHCIKVSDSNKECETYQKGNKKKNDN